MHPFLILNAYKINFECIQFGVRWAQEKTRVPMSNRYPSRSRFFRCSFNLTLLYDETEKMRAVLISRPLG